MPTRGIEKFAIEKLVGDFALSLMALAITVPLAVWKLIDIAAWLWHLIF